MGTSSPGSVQNILAPLQFHLQEVPRHKVSSPHKWLNDLVRVGDVVEPNACGTYAPKPRPSAASVIQGHRPSAQLLTPTSTLLNTSQPAITPLQPSFSGSSPSCTLSATVYCIYRLRLLSFAYLTFYLASIVILIPPNTSSNNDVKDASSCAKHTFFTKLAHNQDLRQSLLYISHLLESDSQII